MLGDRLYVQKATVSWYCSEACFFLYEAVLSSANIYVHHVTFSQYVNIACCGLMCMRHCRRR